MSKEAPKRTKNQPHYKAIAASLRVELAQVTAERDLFKARLSAEQGYSNSLAATLRDLPPATL